MNDTPHALPTPGSRPSAVGSGTDRRDRRMSIGLGLAAAIFVAAPVLPAGTARNSNFLLVVALVAVVLVRAGATRWSGRATALWCAAVVVALLLLSVSFALVSLDLAWAVAVVAVVAFVAVARIAPTA